MPLPSLAGAVAWFCSCPAHHWLVSCSSLAGVLLIPGWRPALPWLVLLPYSSLAGYAVSLVNLWLVLLLWLPRGWCCCSGYPVDGAAFSSVIPWLMMLLLWTSPGWYPAHPWLVLLLRWSSPGWCCCCPGHPLAGAVALVIPWLVLLFLPSSIGWCPGHHLSAAALTSIGLVLLFLSSCCYCYRGSATQMAFQ